MEGTAEIPTQYRLRVKQRLAVVEYVRQHGIKPASRQFGLARPTVREWWRNWQRAGVQGLVPHYPARRQRRISEDVVALITQARLEHGVRRQPHADLAPACPPGAGGDGDHSARVP